jgi:phage shock protein A
MGLWARVLVLFKGKANAALDRAEDPREMLDYAYRQQQELLVKVKQGLVDVATARAGLEQQAARLRTQIPRWEEQAERALALGREDLARAALGRKHAALAEVEGLQGQILEVANEEAGLAATQRELAARIEEFRSRRTVVAARYSAAEARVRVSEALGGISSEAAEVGMALGRAEEKTERLQGRAAALDALLAADSLDALDGGASFDHELRRLGASRAAEEELAQLKRSSQRLALDEPDDRTEGA